MASVGTTRSRPVLLKEHVVPNVRANKDPLPADIWYLIAHDYLVDSPTTVAVLSSINRRFHALLHLLKFRVVFIRLNTSSGKISNTSPARRFAQMIRLREPNIVDHVQVLWIGNKEEVKLPAINDGFPEDTERRSLCYILSLRYPILKHLTLSFKPSYLPAYPISQGLIRTLPSSVLHSISSALSLPSLSEVSVFMRSMPSKIYSRLQEARIHTLNVCVDMIDGEDMQAHRAMDWHSRTDKLRTLRIDETGGRLFSVLLLHITSNSTRLTTLVLKCTMYSAYLYLPKVTCPTLITLKIYFIRWHYYIPGSHVVDLKAFSALRTLMLGFNLNVKKSPAEAVGHQRLQWITDVLGSIKPEQPLERINLFIDDLDHSTGWLNRIGNFPWSNFKILFSPESSERRWPTLQQINVGFAPGYKRTFEPSDWSLLEDMLRPKLALPLFSGILRLDVPIFRELDFFDDF